jgi:dihydropteroate synthase
VLDPGFGFGKIRDENYPLLAHFDQLQTLGFPLLAGLSRKSFLSHALSNPVDPQPAGGTGKSIAAIPEAAPASLHSEMGELSRELPTTIANTAAILAGAHILRVHTVRPARHAAAIADRLLEAS